MPKVSVIMPAYNAEKYIKGSIDSVLSQTYGDFEFIILDDCSRDSTQQIILSYGDPRIVYVKNEKNLGVAGTLNRGLELAQGEYVARMDADDIAMPERLALQTQFLNEHPEVCACGSNAVLFGADRTDEQTDMPLKQRDICLRMALSNPFVHPTMMFRKDALQGVVYDSTFEGREDYRMWMVLSRKGQMENLPQALLRYRIHGGQVTQQTDESKVQKHFRLKKTYYTELNIGLTDAMQEALCHAAFYGKVKDDAMVQQLKLGLERISKSYGCRKMPREYSALLCSVLRDFSRSLRWRMSVGLPLHMRLGLLR